MEQRKIKFRIWNKKTNMWEFDYEKLGGVNLFGEIHAMGYFSIVDLNDFIPMQYTGLKDKNGTEIYENDIIKYSLPSIEEKEFEFEYIEQVTFVEGCFVTDGSTPIYVCLEYCTVIGNKFQNPDLLK